MDEYRAFLLNAGQAIKAERENAGITQAQLAKSVGTSQNAVYCYESGRTCMSIWMLRNLCEMLGLSADEVLGLEEQ